MRYENGYCIAEVTTYTDKSVSNLRLDLNDAWDIRIFINGVQMLELSESLIRILTCDPPGLIVLDKHTRKLLRRLEGLLDTERFLVDWNDRIIRDAYEPL